MNIEHEPTIQFEARLDRTTGEHVGDIYFTPGHDVSISTFVWAVENQFDVKVDPESVCQGWFKAGPIVSGVTPHGQGFLGSVHEECAELDRGAEPWTWIYTAPSDDLAFVTDKEGNPRVQDARRSGRGGQ